MAGKAKLYTNPETGDTKTAVQWSVQLGFSNTSSFTNRFKKLGAFNPRTWETKKQGVMRRVNASIKSRQGKVGNNSYRALVEHSDAPDPGWKPGTWEAKHLSHLGR